MHRGVILGVLSDSHGRAAMTRHAIDALRAGGAETFIHLGDFETPDVLDELAGLDAHVVFGNCDADEAKLRRYAQSLSIAVHHPAGRLRIGDRTVAFTHGHLERELQTALQEEADYLLHGHTHVVRDERVGATRVINPGALFRARRYTAALLIPAMDILTFVDVEQ